MRTKEEIKLRISELETQVKVKSNTIKFMKDNEAHLDSIRAGYRQKVRIKDEIKALKWVLNE